MRITKRLFVFVFYFAVQRYDLFRTYANISALYAQPITILQPSYNDWAKVVITRMGFATDYSGSWYHEAYMA